MPYKKLKCMFCNRKGIKSFLKQVEIIDTDKGIVVIYKCNTCKTKITVINPKK